jgi:hypothetical protein
LLAAYMCFPLHTSAATFAVLSVCINDQIFTSRQSPPSWSTRRKPCSSTHQQKGSWQKTRAQLSKLQHYSRIWLSRHDHGRRIDVPRVVVLAKQNVVRVGGCGRPLSPPSGLARSIISLAYQNSRGKSTDICEPRTEPWNITRA